MARRTFFNLMLVIQAFSLTPIDAAEIPIPRVTDPRLKLELFAAEPEIVTPAGMTVDAQGRVLAIESHTHFRPKDYDGPPADRIRRFEDTDGDGKADKITTFFEGTTHTMSVALYKDGSVFVATRNEIFRLRDKDGDGVAEERTKIAHLESDDNYPHSGLGGFAFDKDSGDVFFGLGENHAKAFKLIGSDGTVLTGIEGGHVYRCRPDGSKLERVSIGCWNPHALATDAAGRLFAVDNDPDSLPPCRLLQIVPGGDYGYKYRNGRKGTHPYTSWNGEVPGTLPMISGTGEAPSGILVCGKNVWGKTDKLPSDYCGDLLVTSWGDHRIERYKLVPRGASFTAERTDVVIGDENFRPVGIVAGGDGAVYFTDWVDKSYNLHKKGRIWRLSVKSPEDAKPAKEIEKDVSELLANSLRFTELGSKTIWFACHASDPFMQQAAREGLKRMGRVKPDIDLKPLSVGQRLAVLCILRDLGTDAAQSRLRDFLADADPGIRLVALKWIGEERLADQRENLKRVLTAGPMTARLFAAYLATQEKLDRPARKDSDEWASEQYAATALVDETTPPEARRWALRTLRPTHKEITSERIRKWLNSDDELLRLEAVRTLRESQLADRETLLAEIGNDAKADSIIRCEAIVGMQPSSPEVVAGLVRIANDENRILAAEALRSLRGGTLNGNTTTELRSLSKKDAEFTELVKRVIEPSAAAGEIKTGESNENTAAQAEVVDRWLAQLEGPADAAAGERIFFHTRAGTCSNCHQKDGRGAQIGPDLTVAGHSLERRRLVESILFPSKEIAPQLVSWVIQTDGGKQLTGVLVGENVDGSQRYADATGKTFTLKPGEIESRTGSAISIMPSGLERQLTLQEFKDLLAYLQKR